MATKTDRVEARLSPGQRELIDRAAAFEGQSLSAFMVTAAAEKAEEVVARQTTSILPSDYFDRLLSAIDDAESAPSLAKAAKKARQRRRIR